LSITTISPGRSVGPKKHSTYWRNTVAPMTIEGPGV
jgi:hypothetical protein